MANPQPPVDLEPWATALRGKTFGITGSSGFVASRLVPSLLAAGTNIVPFLRPESPEPNFTSDSVRGDPKDPCAWDRLLDGQADVIIHLAARSSVREAAQDPVGDWNTNVLPFIRLLDACRRQEDPPTVILASTATVHGLTPDSPVDESFPSHPLTIYDLHKLQAEEYLRRYVAEGHVRGAALRLSNVYGPGPASATPDRGIIGQMVRRALAGNDLTVYAGGPCLRDFVHVDDVVRAFAAVAATPAASASGEPFLVATGHGVSLRTAFEAIAAEATALTGHAVRTLETPPPASTHPIDGRSFTGNPARLAARTGWKPVIAFKEGLAATVRQMDSDLALARQTA